MRIELESLDLATAERLLCETALHQTGSIVEGARLLGITRHALKRRIIKYKIEWPRPTQVLSAPSTTETAAS